MPRGYQPGVVTGLRSEAKLLRGLDLACISMGGKAEGAEEKIGRLIDGGATGLVSFGIAGALHPDLRTGDVVVAEAVTSAEEDVWLAHGPWFRALAPQTPPVTTPPSQDNAHIGTKFGTVLGLDNLLSSPMEKAAVFARTGALAIDMESHHVARAAAARGLPFIAVRAISDRADEMLPACFAGFVDGEGRTKMSAVLAALIFRRVRLGELLAAGRSSRLAHQALFRCRGALAGLR